jgi:hypothetical protein
MSKESVNLRPSTNEQLAWIRANGLDPHRVKAHQTAIIEDGKLTLDLFEVDGHGHKIIQYAADGEPEAKLRTITVPLISEPEDHGVETS